LSPSRHKVKEEQEKKKREKMGDEEMSRKSQKGRIGA
jgi:hypothetical protein